MTASALPLSYVPVRGGDDKPRNTARRAQRQDIGDAPLEQMAGIEPAIPVRQTGVSPQHFICMVPPVAGERKMRAAPGGTFRIERKKQEHAVSRAGIEPASCGLKDRCKGQRLLPTRERRAQAQG